MEKGRILVVDDDPVVSLSCKRLLGAEGFDALSIDRGQDALRMLEGENFDLLISDVRLPDISGMMVLKEAKAAHPEIDVVIITGYPTLQDAKDSIKLGAMEYMEKPFAPDAMVSVARRALDKRGWLLKKAAMEEQADCIVPLSDGGVVHHGGGVWSRQCGEGLREIGCDVRYPILGGELVYVDFVKGIEVVKRGETFARILSSSGAITDLPSPVTAHIRELNTRANDVIVSLYRSHLSEGWLLRLARALPLSLD